MDVKNLPKGLKIVIGLYFFLSRPGFCKYALLTLKPGVRLKSRMQKATL